MERRRSSSLACRTQIVLLADADRCEFDHLTPSTPQPPTSFQLQLANFRVFRDELVHLFVVSPGILLLLFPQRNIIGHTPNAGVSPWILLGELKRHPNRKNCATSRPIELNFGRLNVLLGVFGRFRRIPTRLLRPKTHDRPG